MKKLYFLLLSGLFISTGTNAQNIDFSYAKFKTYLLTSSTENDIAKDSNGTAIAIDANGDGEISEQEALNIYTLNLDAGAFSDISNPETETFSTEELKYFSNVKFFNCSGLVIGADSKIIDLSGLANLSEVYVESDYTRKYTPVLKLPDFMPELKVLHYAYGLIDFSRMPVIEDLNISGGYYSDVTISNITSLKKLRVPSDIPGTLSLTNLPNLNDFRYANVGSASNLTGLELISLENLPALKELEIETSETNGLIIKNVTIKNLPNLTKLDCINTDSNIYPGGMGIQSLTLNDLPKLATLDCSKNSLASLDISNLTSLISLDCSYNQITNLNISGNTNLTSLNCSNNILISIDISNNSKLTYLNCHMNNLTQLDVSNNPELTELGIGLNEITELDLYNNKKISILNLNLISDMKKLIMKNNIIDAWLDNSMGNFRTIEYVCCDESEIEKVKQKFSTLPTPPLTITSSCSTMGTDETVLSPVVSLYPNPVQNTLFINSKDTIKKAEIFDSNGRLLISQYLSDSKINVSSLSKGIYLISVYSDKGKINQRFIKE